MRSFFLALILFPTLLSARPSIHNSHFNSNRPYKPWLTGPLLAPTPVNMKPGHPAIEPSITFFSTYGLYNNNWKLERIDTIWAVNPLIDFQFAITERTGIETIAAFVTRYRDGETYTNVQDTIVLFGYQVADDIKDSWVPNFRLFLSVTFPTGKYDKLNPSLRGLDITGEGAYFLGPSLSFEKLFYLPKNYLSLQWSIAYLSPTKTNIRGLSLYGGGPDTRGKLRPGQFLTSFFSGEYTFNQHWVFAFDTNFFYQTATSTFEGTRGLNLQGEPASPGLPQRFQFSLAPELEYNFSEDSGLLFGLWGSLFGRNARAFASAFIAYVHTF